MHIVVSREDYFAAARTILADEGVSKLKIGTLCRALNVTSGSFYGYFGSLQGFIDEFLQDWEATQLQRIAEHPEVDGDDRERLHRLRTFIDELPHDTESALRGWSHINDAVAVVQERIDNRRQAVLIEHIEPIVGPDRARTLAVAGIAMLIGIQQWRRPVDTAHSEALFRQFERLVLANAEDAENADHTQDGGGRSRTALRCNKDYVTNPNGFADEAVGGER